MAGETTHSGTMTLNICFHTLSAFAEAIYVSVWLLPVSRNSNLSDFVRWNLLPHKIDHVESPLVQRNMLLCFNLGHVDRDLRYIRHSSEMHTKLASKSCSYELKDESF
jgi:hypothetical protein